jgi:hypothetical protein
MKKTTGSSRVISVLGRGFKMRLVRFSNGCFFSLSEGSNEKIGSLMLSLIIHGRAEHTIIIPERRAGVFLQIVSDTIANITQGLTIVSIYLLNEVDTELAKGLLKDIKEFFNTSG